MARSVTLWNDFKGSQEVTNLENGKLAQETITANIDTWNLSKDAILQGKDYNSVTITPANGILVNTATTAVKINGVEGFAIYNNKIASGDKRVAYIDTSGNLNLKGNITMDGGSISWAKLSGQNPTADANNTLQQMKGNTAISGMFVDQSGKLVLNADSILAGKVKADYITVGSKSTFESGYSPGEIKNDAASYSDEVSSISKSIRVRYVRDWAAGNNENQTNHWVQVKVFQGPTNVAAGKAVTSNAALTNADRITNGDITTSNYANGASSNTLQYVQIDLGQVYNDIDYVQVWHYASGNPRQYNKTKIEVSEDGVKWTRIFDSAVSGTYVETTKGLIATVNAGSVVGSTTTRLETIDGQITASVEEQKKTNDNVSKVSGRLDVMSDKVSIVVKEEGGKNVIDGTALVGAINVTPSTVMIEAKNVNLKGAVTFESLATDVSTKVKSSITQDDALGLIQKTYNNGIYMKQDYQSFTAAKVNCLYIHGFNKNGDPADVDGFIMVNGVKQNVVKGKLEPGVTGEGYIMYSTISNVWFMAKYDGTSGKWTSYNVGTASHAKELPLDDRYYFVGYISI